MPKVQPYGSPRSSFPASSSDFALPPSSYGSSLLSDDSTTPLLPRFRRPALQAPKTIFTGVYPGSDTRLHSPLANSYTASCFRRRGSINGMIPVEDVESDREEWSVYSPGSSSQNPTPPLGSQEHGDAPPLMISSSRRMPATPPRRSSITNAMDIGDGPLRIARRLSFPLKNPRMLNLLAESRPEEDEVKSEAAFQRLITSGAELPIPPRTPRGISDRGRYPEEAGQDEESQREESPSDDDGEGAQTEDEQPFAFMPPSSSGSSLSLGEPMHIITNGNTGTRTPAQSVNGDDMCVPESPSASAMDVDTPSGFPSYMPTSISSPISSNWRYTPPPTASAVRSNKRKFDDRFDPYPTAAKRRAVSPSISSLRESHRNHAHAHNHATRSTSRSSKRNSLPHSYSVPIPIAVSNSSINSAASSPTIGGFAGNMGSGGGRPPLSLSCTSSPTLRPSVMLASPILRPLGRVGRRDEEEEREIEGAGDAVGGLTLA